MLTKLHCTAWPKVCDKGRASEHTSVVLALFEVGFPFVFTWLLAFVHCPLTRCQAPHISTSSAR